MVDGAPEIIALASDADEQFIQMPRVTWVATSMSQLLRERLAKRETPQADGFMADDHAAFGQQFLNLPEAEAKAIIQPDGMGNNLGWKAVILI